MKLFNMEPHLKAKWLAALRSGDYIQGTGFLRRAGFLLPIDGTSSSDTYCCMGVLCDVNDPGCWSLQGSKYDAYGSPLTLKGDLLGAVGGVDVTLKLEQLNDVERWDFNKIADWIEEHL